jgi:hypothetical protein
MPALIGYIVAVSLLIASGYASLHWLSTPDASTHPRSIASKALSTKKSDARPARETPADEQRNERAETDISTASESSGKAAAETPSKPTGATADVSDPQARKAQDASAGGCMPLGITARGQLVFPMQCVPESHGRLPDAEATVSAGSAPSDSEPKQIQTSSRATEPDKPVADKSAQLNQNEPPRIEAMAKAADISPATDVKPGREKPESEAVNGRKVRKRNLQSAHSRPVMMILRTIEFPDGHREQRLLPISHSRRTALRTEEDDFDWRTFR